MFDIWLMGASRHQTLAKPVRTCADCVSSKAHVSAIPKMGPDDHFDHITSTMTVLEVWECERYEGSAWNKQHLAGPTR